LRVLASVQFYDQLLFKADEINNESVYRLLSSEFQIADLSIPKLTPQDGLNSRCIFSQAFSGFCQIKGHR